MEDEAARISELVTLMERFARGVDCSLVAANTIESAILQLFPEGDELRELADDLASYRPEGGIGLYSEVHFRPIMAKWCVTMWRRFGAEGKPSE